MATTVADQMVETLAAAGVGRTGCVFLFPLESVDDLAM